MESLKKIPFKITLKKKKNLRNKSNKKVKDFYVENYKILIKETENDSKVCHVLGLKELILLKWSYCPN